MSVSMSRLARNGSVSSTSSTSTTDSSSHHHILSHLLHSRLDRLSLLYHDPWSVTNHRHERIATGTVSTGMAVLTREMMEMQIQQAPDVRGMMDCLPTRQPGLEMGWRTKLGTWPITKHEAMVPRKFTL